MLDTAFIVSVLRRAAGGVDPCAFGCAADGEAEKPVGILVVGVIAVADVDLDGGIWAGGHR